MDPSFLIPSLILVGFVLACAATGRTREGLWYGWLTALLLLPSWTEVKLDSAQRLDLRSVAALAALAGFVICPDRGIRFRWSSADAILGLLMGTMMFSEYRSGDLGATTVPTLAIHWLIPYLVGRSFFRTTDDVRRVGRFIGVVIVLLAVYGVSEMVSHTNPALLATNQRFVFLEQEQGERMGLRRAQGLCSHPIFFGLTFVLLLPWAFEGWRQSRAGEVSNWNRWLPFTAAVGALSSLSRGPILAGLMTAAAYIFFRAPRLRAILAAMALGGCVLAWSGSEFIMSELSNVIGENDENAIPIVIKGEVVNYSGTRHRVLQFKAYEDATAEAGLFGFGDQIRAVRDRFPVHPLFWSIDCTYLILLLRFGWSGLAIFLVLTVDAIYRLGRIAWSPSGELSGLAGGLCGAFAALAIALFSVYLAYDFGALWIFCVGLSVNLADLDRGAFHCKELFTEGAYESI